MDEKQKELLIIAALLVGMAANLLTIAETLKRSEKPRKRRKPRKQKRQ